MTKLEKFLRKEGVLDKFTVNLKSEKAIGELTFDGRTTLNSFFNRGWGFEEAFCWISTPEGGDFWYNLNAKFEKIK